MITFPQEWWSDRPLILGHRGASRRAPENTLAAFQAALEDGADGVELDVHVTEDGVPVVIHNGSVDQTTDGTGLVNALSLDQIRALDAGSRFSATFAGERVPTLEEVLAAYGERLLVNIELKPQSLPGADVVTPVARLIERLGLQRRIWVSSFKPYLLFRMRQLAPEIPCGQLFSPLSLPSLCLLPVTPVEALHPHVSLLSRWSVWIAHRLDFRVAAWTVDAPSVFRDLARWDVDAIITNDPAAAVDVLRSAERAGPAI
ncbi:MAG: glycerophosphodiester phosphodiesterase [Anaerolineae bacterium]